MIAFIFMAFSRRPGGRFNRGRIPTKTGPAGDGGGGTTPTVINVDTGTNVIQSDTTTNVIQVGL